MEGFGSIGHFEVRTTTDRGFSVEEVAEDLLNKLLYISNNAPEPIKAQAVAFRAQIKPVIIHYMRQAVKSDRTTLASMLSKQGHHDMAEIIRKL